MNNPKANLFIAGAAKAGTTSLYHWLRQHPNVFMSPVKEPNYFSTDIDPEAFSSFYKKNTYLHTDKYFSQNRLDDLQVTFIRKSTYYNQLFQAANQEAYLGEASTSYMYSFNAAKEIYRYNPESRIIFILRNPAERAYSHYLMALKYGHVYGDFYSALQNDINRNNKGWGRSELFVELGFYYDQLKRYFKLFPQKQLLILLYEDLKADPLAARNTCLRFLGLSTNIDFEHTVKNTGQVPRVARLNHWLAKTGIKQIIKTLIPGKLKRSAKQVIYSSKYQPMPKEASDLLMNIYRKDIKKTATLIQRDLSHWIK